MRRIVSTSMILAAAMVAMPAMAGSISTVTGLSASQPSILEINCAHCPAPEQKVGKSHYEVPAIASGYQAAEVVEIDGEKKLKRVERWFGGSPVVVYSSAAGWATDGSTVVAGALPTPNEIDHATTTAAVDAPADGKAAPTLAGFELRLN
jgi:hypothetical protein